jgi:DNA/RNA-binding domain of Phe-tRNA-synthetase-like protein
VRGVYYNIRDMRNLPSTDPNIRAFVNDQLSSVSDDLDESTVLAGYRDLYRLVSSKPDKLTAAPASLLSYFRAKKDIPRINGIVDVYNSISLASGIAIGAHDLAHVDGDIILRLTTGSETFWPLGSSKTVRVPAGEYAYTDSGNEILCRLEVRQVEKSKVTLESRNVFFIIQGHRAVDSLVIETTAKTLAAACRQFFGGELEFLYPDSRG